MSFVAANSTGAATCQSEGEDLIIDETGMSSIIDGGEVRWSAYNVSKASIDQMEAHPSF